MNNEKTKTVVLCGVGGQGTILAAHVLADAALDAGLDVKVSEIHGMAQRGGAVQTVVRVGENVESMVADIGSVDILCSFETTEALRHLPELAQDGSLIVNDIAIKPQPVAMGAALMPENPRKTILDVGGLIVPAESIAKEVGNPRTENIVLLGALSARLDFPMESWEKSIRIHVPPHTVDDNLEAFRGGRAFIEERTEARQ
ncbi:MAG: indolepyruvate oxidoreductase subunit beta [Eggerthellaceae bacterium]|nr:indolepyruvate oxidoreductase subunit beta [Eggerthellaceae bacterium]